MDAPPGETSIHKRIVGVLREDARAEATTGGRHDGIPG